MTANPCRILDGTLGSFRHMAVVVITLIAVMLVLAERGVALAPNLGAAGVVGPAPAFGAQIWSRTISTVSSCYSKAKFGRRRQAQRPTRRVAEVVVPYVVRPCATTKTTCTSCPTVLSLRSLPPARSASR
jgi:hypothetical protein